MTKNGIISAPAALTHCDAYPERTDSVHHIETHISHVFLIDRFAYKIKKPVQFDFLDFSTLQQRRWMCAEEVRLNRRLAPDVYLGVVPIARDDSGNVRVGHAGTPIEWAVKMRRLTEPCRFDHLLQKRRVAPADVDRIVKLFVTFYRGLPSSEWEASTYVDHVRTHVEANRQDLLAAYERLGEGKLEAFTTVRRIHSRQLEFLTLKRSLLEQRASAEGRQGCIIEGHGDLRPEHLYLEEYPVAIDCLEFSEALRTVDVADELMFLAMECELLGEPAIGNEIATRCLEKLHDDPPPKLLMFYRCYRACVRAKVAALRAEQVDDEPRSAAVQEANSYLTLADRAARGFGSPLLTVVRGLMGTGKSTIGNELSRLLGAQLLQTDAIRRELFGASNSEAGYGEGNYTPTLRRRVYEEMFQRADRLLNDGISVVLDGTFLKRSQRREALGIAQRHSAQFVIANCLCPNDVIYDRILSRCDEATVSEARPDLLAAQRNEEEPFDEDLRHIDLDTTGNVSQSTDRLIDAM